MAPKNYSGQVYLLGERLRAMGQDVDQLEYVSTDASASMGYRSHKTVNLDPAHVIEGQLKALQDSLAENYDIYHFWNRSMFFVGRPYEMFMGMDIALIKARGKKVIYRFTGNDIRYPSLDKEVNPYSFYNYGYESPYDETDLRRYVEYLRAHVDQFVVQDPELQQFIPEATVVPRCLKLEDWPNVGLQNDKHPVVVHASTNDMLKGTRFIEQAVAELQDEGLKFRYTKVSNLMHSDAIKIYKGADICIDNLHQGCLTVFAMECMALGKATMNYIRDDLYKPAYGNVPVENVNPDNIKDKLRLLITDLEHRKELSIQGRHFIETHFDVKNVAEQLLKVYHEVADRSGPQRTDGPWFRRFRLPRRTNPATQKYVTNGQLPTPRTQNSRQREPRIETQNRYEFRKARLGEHLFKRALIP